MDCDVFVIGENYIGVRSDERILETWCPLKK
ncbi:hypothetical protein [Candidatus Curculioniphilus buchneri]